MTLINIPILQGKRTKYAYKYYHIARIPKEFSTCFDCKFLIAHLTEETVSQASALYIFVKTNGQFSQKIGEQLLSNEIHPSIQSIMK